MKKIQRDKRQKIALNGTWSYSWEQWKGFMKTFLEVSDRKGCTYERGTQGGKLE